MNKELDVYYDEEGDFFEIHVGPYTKGYFDNLGDEIFQCIDESKKDKEVTGVVIICLKARMKEGSLKLEYNEETDTIQFYFYPQANTESDKTIKVSDEVTLTYHKKNIRSMTLIHASKHLPEKIMQEALTIL